jgi:rfaE bifunctional protein nucleotidyltransferase chain/domain
MKKKKIPKILSVQKLRLRILSEKKKGKKIVLANGIFDILHVGHVRYLQDAKKKGDVLVVGLNSDRSARRNKGAGRPLMKEEDRAQIIASLSCVDYVTIFNEERATKLILSIKPHYHCKGTDYTERNVPEREAVLSYGGKICITGDPKGHSASEIISKIQESHHR